MRTACTLAVLLVCHMAARAARPADVEPPKNDATTRSTGRVMVVRIEPGGKVDIQGSIPEDVMKMVEEARRKAVVDVEQARKSAEQARKSAEQARSQAQRAADAVGTFDTQGTIVVVGPDGVTHTQAFRVGAGNAPGLQFDIVKSLEAAGVGLCEQDRARLMRALPAVAPVPPPFPPAPHMPAVSRVPGAPPVPPVGNAALPAMETIAGKLDRILERLEKLEQDVAAIKSPKGSD